MNAGIYKLIFSKRLNALVVVGENCSSQGKAPGTTRALKRSARGMVQIVKILGMFSSGALLVSSAWATPAQDALPTGGQVAQGSASISQSGAQMDINQASQRAVINWQSFDVGANARVHVIQPNQAAVLLNRVVTNKPSEIYGKIDANGQVILVNANGIIFGQDGSASASSFTATTLDISDKDFMEGKTRFSSNGAQGEIVNHGTIEAKDGGYVALLGAKVTNDGKIITHNGTVALGAADSIAIPMTSSGKIKMELSAGSINAAVENTKNGVIVTEGGDVYLQAAAANHAMASITNSGQIDTSGEQAGKAVLLADNGEIKVDGSITANSSNAAHKGGDIIIGRDAQTGVLAKATNVSGAKLESQGGFVETSGDWLATRGATVLAKDWLLDPTDIKIVAVDTATQDTASSNVGGTTGTTTFQDTTALAASEVLKSTIESAINNGTNVTISTANAPGTGEGNITIETSLSFNNAGSQDATLSLLARNGIIQNGGASITATGSKLVNVLMTAEGLPGGVAIAAGVTDANSKGITLNSNITTNGKITLTGTSNAPSGANGVGVNSLGTLSAGGNVLVTGKANGASTGVNTGAITSTGGTVTVIGTSAAAAGATTGVINAAGNVEITGTSNDAVSNTSTGASTGNIISTGGTVKVTGNAKAGAAVKVANITTGAGTGIGKDITIIGNSTSGAVLSGSGVINAAGKVSITGTGNNAGNNPSPGYAITTNGTIKATDDIEIKTTSAAKHGMNLNGAIESTGGKVTIYADVLTAGSGSAMNGTATIKASGDINITGKTNGYFSINGLGAITSTNGNVTVDGLSTGSVGVKLTNNISALNGHVALTGTGGNAEGVIFDNGTGITAKSYNVQGTSATSVGVKFNGTATFNSSADSFIEGKNSSGGTSVYAANWPNAININSSAGKVVVRNQTGSSGGMEFRSGVSINTTGDVTFGRNDQPDNSLYLQNVTATANGGKLTFLGSSSSKDGIAFQDFGGGAVNINGINGAQILIDGKSTANGSSGVNMRLVGPVTHNVTSSGAGGSITINGTSTLGKGVNVDIAKITSNNGNVINITGTGGGTGEGVYIANAVTANGGGNINITGNTAINNGSGTAVNINTNGGAGTVVANGAAGVPAGKITIIGNAGTGIGIANSAVIKGGTVEMTGTSAGTNSTVYSSGAIEATVAGVSIKGTNTNATATGGGGTTLQGKVTAVGDINLEGYSSNTGSNQGLVIQNAMESTGGNITVTGQTNAASQRAVAITANGAVNGSLKVADGKTININANTLLINTGSTVNAGTGTVNIKTTTAGNEILIGGVVANDLMGTNLSSQKLGIDNTELNRITAGNTVIGDTTSTGKITVAAATTTLAQTGNITLQTKGDILVDKALTVATGKTLTLNGAGPASQIKQNAAITATNLELLGDNATHTLTNTGNAVGTLAAKVKSLDFKNASTLTVGQVNGTTGITADTGVSVTTQTSNLTIAKAITNSTSGNVVLGAGVSYNAGVGTGGDVKTTAGATVTNDNGDTYIYTGSAATTGLLSRLDNSFSELRLSGDMGGAQNADSNVKYAVGTTIAGGAKAQVMFREKVALNTSTIVAATLDKTYGDANTSSLAVDQAALFAEMKDQLKQVNTGEIITRSLDGSNGAGEFKISKASLINDFSGSLVTTAASFSTSDHLKATTHDYGALTSSKYSATLAAGEAKVVVAKKALSGSIATGNTTYGDTLVAGAVSALGGVVGVDSVSANGVTIDTSGRTSTSGNLKADTHSGIQGLTGLSGADKDNYSFADVKGDYKVSKLALTGANIADAGNVYGDDVRAGAVDLSVANIISGDDLRGGKASVVSVAGDLSSGNLKVGKYNQQMTELFSGNSNEDANNYDFSGVTTTLNYTVSERGASIPTDGNTVVTDPLLNPVPVNPDYKSPNSSVGGANELVTTQQNNEQIQKQCSLEFAKECKVQPASVQEIAPKYVTFY